MTVETIDLGDIAILITLLAIFLGMVTIIVVLLWQTSRSDAKIDGLRAETSQKFDAQRTEFTQKLESTSRDLTQEIKATRTELSQRTSEVELAQARQDGVNSVLQNQTHTHEVSAD